MDWVGFVSLLIAFAAFIGVIWQIARTEGMRAPASWNAEISRSRLVVNNVCSGHAMFTPMTDFNPSDVELAVWGSARIVDEDGSMVFTPGRASGKIEWNAGDNEAFVGVTWIRPSYFRRKPVAAAYRVRLERHAAVSPQSGLATRESELSQWWHWSLLQPLRREKSRRGRWKVSKPFLRSALPPAEAPNE